VLGGSALYFSYAASFFTPVRLVGVVGDDWSDGDTQMLEARGINTAGLHVVDGGKTFYWKGKYEPNMNDRETLEVHLNVFGDFRPQLPGDFQDSEFVFLANGAPAIQMSVMDQVPGARLTVADTMDLWIREERDDLLALMKRVDGLVLNDSEAILLTEKQNIFEAGQQILGMGPRFVVIKKGEHGAIFISEDSTFVLPAFPTGQVVDPTGAGDSFAGGMMGYLTESGQTSMDAMKRAVTYGTLVASFNVEDFSLERMKEIERVHLQERFESYRKMLLLDS